MKNFDGDRPAETPNLVRVRKYGTAALILLAFVAIGATVWVSLQMGRVTYAYLVLWGMLALGYSVYVPSPWRGNRKVAASKKPVMHTGSTKNAKTFEPVRTNSRLTPPSWWGTLDNSSTLPEDPESGFEISGKR